MASSFKTPSFNSQQFLKDFKEGGSLTVIDFQWRFAVTTKHSLTNHSDCLIQLKLVLANSSPKSKQQANKIIHLQLSMKEFNQFYREMQKISNTLAIIN